MNNKITDSLSFSSFKSTPVILQSEVSECGLACIAMISTYYEQKITIQTMREFLVLDKDGMNLQDLIKVSQNLDLSARALQCEIEELKQVSLPCILHWDMNHFVVLTKIKGRNFYINDPAFGEKIISEKDFGKHFTGILLELFPQSDFKRKDIRKIMKMSDLWGRISGLKSTLLSLFILSVLIQVISLTTPYYIQLVVDNVLINNDKNLLIVLAIGFGILLFIGLVIKAFREWLILRISSFLSIQMGSNLFHHMIRLPHTFFENRHVGDIISRFGSLTQIKEILTTGIIEAIVDGIMSLTVIVVMMLYSVKLTFITLFFVSIYTAFRMFFYFPYKRLTESYINSSAKEETFFLETIRSIQAIKLFSKEADRQNLWLNKYSDVINFDIKIGKYKIYIETINNAILGLKNIIVLYFAATLVMNNELTIGMLLAFLAYKDQFITSVFNLIEKFVKFKMLSLYLERISDIALHKKEKFRGKLKKNQCRKGKIELKNISFSYGHSEKNIINNLSIVFNERESIAITGVSGCGKSTLMKIIIGMLQPDQGEVLIDGVNINKLGLVNYRELITVVMQDDHLLSGTIADNITFFDASPDIEWMEKCAETAFIAQEISNMPMGYMTLVGDMNNGLSGGQIQRLFLARALYKKPLILCLDEATSHLDIDNEKRINEAIKNLNITRIIIAHRKETINAADRVVHII